MTRAAGIPLRYVVEEIDERSGANLPLLSVSIHLGVRRRDELTDDDPRADTLETYKRCRRGDVVVNRMRAFQGALGVAPVDGLVSPDYAVLRPSAVAEARFVSYVLRSPWGVAEMSSRLRGIGGVASGVVRTPRVNVADLLDIRIPLPSVDRQREITHFLNRECERIAQLSAVMDAMRTTAAEWRVARTLDAIEAVSVGETRVRRLLRGAQQGWSPECEDRLPDDSEWGVLKAGAVNGGVFRSDQVKTLPTTTPPRLAARLRTGDVLMNRASGSLWHLGSVAIANDVGPRTLFSDKLYRLTPDPSTADAALLVTVLSLPSTRSQIERDVSGGDGMANNLPLSIVKGLTVPAVPMQDWPPIRDELSALRLQETLLTTTVGRALRTLAEYRDALVTEAVTGQLDVSAVSDAQMDERAHAAAEGALPVDQAPARVR